jgi:hypothetical protein
MQCTTTMIANQTKWQYLARQRETDLIIKIKHALGVMGLNCEDQERPGGRWLTAPQ